LEKNLPPEVELEDVESVVPEVVSEESEMESAERGIFPGKVINPKPTALMSYSFNQFYSNSLER
jgi:hypothetical protein